MNPDHLRFAAVMLAAGAGVPVLAMLNAQLGLRLGAPAAAACVLLVVAFLGAVAVMLFTTGPAPLAKLAAQPRYLLFGGLLMTFYLVSVTVVAPRFGLGNAIFCVLVGQMVSAAVIDHFGLMGAPVKPISLIRATGIAVMAAGVLLTQRG